MDEQPKNTGQEQDAAQEPDLRFEREEDFASLYANNVKFERSLWDFKMIFGELDQSETPFVVHQHTSMTVPWLQAKLMAYFLELNLSIQEADWGIIPVPHSLIPPRPGEFVTPEMLRGNPLLEFHIKYFSALHDRFFGVFMRRNTGDQAQPEPPKEPEPPKST